jgi:drug/metabolite transporter (DMT)-like permease
MRPADLLRMLALAAIWGSSYALMRIITPVYGGAGTMWLRIGIAGLALLLYAKATSTDLGFRQHWRAYLFIGLMSSALPFWLIGFAMQTLPASYGALLNAASPLFGAVFATLMLGERLGASRVVGLVVGFAGVGMIVNLGPLQVTPQVLLAATACVAATVSYGFISVWIKKYLKGAPNMGLALPLTPWVIPSLSVGMAVLTLALMCSAIAYLLYYRLIADIGPTKAISVTFLIPVFGVMWGVVFLDERLTLGALLGGVVVCVGMSLVLGLWKRSDGVLQTR